MNPSGRVYYAYAAQAEVLNNSKTLSKVFAYLNVEDLKASRLVNKMWFNVATEALGNQIQNIFFSKTSTIQRFNKLVKHSQNHPFHRFTVDFPPCGGFKFNLLDRQAQKFFNRCSCFITELCFPSFNWSDDISLADTHYILFQLCPYLNTLVNLPCKTKLTCQDNFQLPGQRAQQFEFLTSFTLYDNNWYTPSFVVDLLNAMPLLTILKFRYPGRNPGSAEEENIYDRKLNIFNIIKKSYDSGGLRQLCCIDCDCLYATMRNNDIEKLTEMAIPLKKLCAKVFVPDDGEKLEGLLNWYKLTLEVLDLRMYPMTHRVFNFPFMNSVTELTLLYSMFCNDVLDKLPQLKHLKLEKPYIKEQDLVTMANPHFFINGAQMYFNVVSLKIPRVPPCQLKVFAQKFPNLKKLEVTANDEIMHTIYSRMPHLEELKVILTTDFTDAGFTGTDISNMSHWKFKKLVLPKISRDLYNTPFIGYLEKLRTLEINLLYGISQWNQISDLAVICGILYLRKLVTLTIPDGIDFGDKAFHALSYLPSLKTLYVPAECRISMGSLSSMTLRLDPVQIIVRTANNHSKPEVGIPWKFRRVKFEDWLLYS